MTIRYHWRCAGANYHLWDDRGLVGAIEPLADGRHAFVLRSGVEIFRAELPELFDFIGSYYGTSVVQRPKVGQMPRFTPSLPKPRPT